MRSYCWKQAASESIAPGSAQTGASCVRNQQTLGAVPVVYGEELQQRMEGGELWSTFGASFGNSSYLAPSALENCPGSTAFAYCFGAPCRDDPFNSERAICECPWVFAGGEEGTILAVDRNTLACAEQAGDYCSFPHNGGPHNWTSWYEVDKIWKTTFPGEAYPTTCDGSLWTAGTNVIAGDGISVEDIEELEDVIASQPAPEADR